MRALNVLLSVLISLALAFGVLEIGLRILGLGPQPSIQRFDEELGWSKTPNAKGERKTREFDVTYEVNALGLRDDPMSSPKKPDGTFRVVMLGDSFVLGYTVDRRDLFVDLLEDWWQAENRPIDVVNAGTEGYSTDQEVLWLDRHGAEFTPDLVMLFPYENDLYWNAKTRYYRFPKPRFNTDGERELRMLVDPGAKPAFESTAIGALIAARFTAEKPATWSIEGRTLPMEWGAYFEPAPEFMNEAYDRTRGALIHLKATCAELGAALLVVPIPNKASIHTNAQDALQSAVGWQSGEGGKPTWSADRPVETVLDLCKQLSIPTLDPRASLRESARDGTELYFQRDWHLNPDGNRAFARALHDGLDSRGVFPPTLAAHQKLDLPNAPHEKKAPTALFVFAGLWALISTMYALTYKDEPAWLGVLKVGAMLGLVFGIVIGGNKLLALCPPMLSTAIAIVFVVGVLGFVLFKLGRRLGTIAELFLAFTARGHWYLMPLVVVLLTVGSLLVVAASSPLIAPFISTLF
jgi:lysophospholipase L1-like esterase